MARQDGVMFELQWCQLAMADLLGAVPVFLNWAAPGTAPHLALGELQLWFADLDRPAGAVADCEQLLSVAERDRAAKYRFVVDRRRFIVRRALLRQLVASYITQQAATLEFTTNPFGKPQLATPGAPGNLQFNLAVAQNRALYGFTWNRALGVDLAHCRTAGGWTEIVDGFFHPNEAAYIHQLPPPQQERAFYKLWTLKEALVKAGGVGLGDPLAREDFSPLMHNATAPCVDAAGRCWQWTCWEPTNRAFAAVAVEHDRGHASAPLPLPPPCRV